MFNIYKIAFTLIQDWCKAFVNMQIQYLRNFQKKIKRTAPNFEPTNKYI